MELPWMNILFFIRIRISRVPGKNSLPQIIYIERLCYPEHQIKAS